MSVESRSPGRRVEPLCQREGRAARRKRGRDLGKRAAGHGEHVHRFSLGRQFGTSTYADVALRIEDINFFGYQTPAPAQYLAASGDSTLVSLRPSLRFDNRNNPFMATKGQYAEFSFEQGWGTFTWSKFDAEGRAYFTDRQPPRRHRQAVLHPPRPLRHRDPGHPRLRAVLRR